LAVKSDFRVRFSARSIDGAATRVASFQCGALSREDRLVSGAIRHAQWLADKRLARSFAHLVSRSRPSIRKFLLVFSLCFNSASTHALDLGATLSPSAACLTFQSGLSLGAMLPFTKEKLRPGQTFIIVALGSSSTTGFLSFGSAFPDVAKQELSRLHPSTRIDMINSGRIGETIGDNISRIDRDVLSHKPDLVVWQLGTNDVVWRGIAEDVKQRLNEAVARIKAARADVILFDLQYAPMVLANDQYRSMESMIDEVAAQQGVGHFPRFTLMKRAIDGGTRGLVSWDGLHDSSEGQKCVGIALAQMIDFSSR
jgi:acyl-CoA thioesterase I